MGYRGKFSRRIDQAYDRQEVLYHDASGQLVVEPWKRLSPEHIAAIRAGTHNSYICGICGSFLVGHNESLEHLAEVAAHEKYMRELAALLNRYMDPGPPAPLRRERPLNGEELLADRRMRESMAVQKRVDFGVTEKGEDDR